MKLRLLDNLPFASVRLAYRGVAQEIAGQHELGAPFLLRGQGNLSDRIELGNQFSTRSRLLSVITIGLLLFASLLFMVLAIFIPPVMTSLDASSTEGGWSAFMVINAVVLVMNALLGLFCWVQGVLNALRAIADKPVHYPLSIPFL